MSHAKPYIFLAFWLIASLFCLIHNAVAEDLGTYQRELTLSAPTPEDDYPLEVLLTTSNFDYSKAQSTGADIRFYSETGKSLAYWIENWNSSGQSAIWVKIPDMGTEKIYLIYGNSEAVSESDGFEVFMLFDDFSDATTSKGLWSLPASGWSVANGLLQKTASGNIGDVIWKGGKIANLRAKMKLRAATVNGNYDRGFLIRRANDSTACDQRAYLLGMEYWANKLDIGICGGGGSCPTFANTNAYTYKANTWYTLTMSANGPAMTVTCPEENATISTSQTELTNGYFGMCGCWSNGFTYDVDYIFAYNFNSTTPKTTPGTEEPIADGDKDGLPDFIDNCPNIPNPEQSDRDLDAYGDPCDCSPNDPNEPGEDGVCPNCAAPSMLTEIGSSMPAICGLLLSILASLLFFRRRVH